MADTGKLIAFLNARLDEDEKAAKAVQDNSEPWPGQWKADGNHALRTYNGWVLATAGTPGGEFRPGVLAHTARHDPARVFRDIAADRELIRMREDQPGYDLPDGVQEGRDPDERERDEDRAALLDDILAIRAARYDDHPGYGGWTSPASRLRITAVGMTRIAGTADKMPA